MNAPSGLPIRKQVSADRERAFITAFILHRQFAIPAAAIVDPEVFAAAPLKTLARLLRDFVGAHGDAPGRSIKNVYDAWVENEAPTDDDAQAVYDFLDFTSQEADEIEKDPAAKPNVEHLISEFANYTNDRHMVEAAQRALQYMEIGQRDMARAEWEKARDVRVASDDFFDPFDEAEAACTEEELEKLIDWPDAGDEFLGSACTRSSLIGIQAPGKRGKTYLCLEFVYRAIRSRRNVAFFETGDLDRKEMKHRMYARVAQTPVNFPHFEGMQPGEYRYPVGIRLVGSGAACEPQVDFEIKKSAGFSNGKMVSRVRKFKRVYKVNKHARFSCSPNNTLNVAGIDAMLDRAWRQEGFRADVIVVDYADIMAPEPGTQREDLRNRQNATWQAFRRLSQKHHACVVVPTQADVDAYGKATQTEMNFSNDSRKFHHVTAMLAINQTPEERDMQVARLNWLMRRSHQVTKKPLYITQCFSLGMALCQCAI